MTLYERYTTTGTGDGWCGAASWLCMTFTIGTTGTNENHNITSVSLNLRKQGSPGTITCSIRATDENGKPTGLDLTSATYDGDTLGTTYSFVEISLTAYGLLASTKYAIVLRASDAVIWDNAIGWDTTYGGLYTGGSYGSSADSGSTWTLDTDYDLLFNEYGSISSSVFLSPMSKYYVPL